MDHSTNEPLLFQVFNDTVEIFYNCQHMLSFVSNVLVRLVVQLVLFCLTVNDNHYQWPYAGILSVHGTKSIPEMCGVWTIG